MIYKIQNVNEKQVRVLAEGDFAPKNLFPRDGEYEVSRNENIGMVCVEKGLVKQITKKG